MMASPASEEISEKQFRFRQHLVQDPKAVVVLLGWLGSVDKYVGKYASALYTPLGCSSVRTTVAGWDMYFNWDACADTLMAGIQLAESVAPGVPIIVHVFSNGGCSCVSGLLSRASSSDSRSQEAAVALGKVSSWVFDSCPAYLHTSTGAGAVSEGFTNPIAKALAYGGMYAVLGSATLFAPTVATDFWTPLLRNKLPAPQLYIYSQNDALTRAEDLEPLMATRRAGSFPVHALKFEDSPHVSHFRKYPGVYSSAIAATVFAACSADGAGAEEFARQMDGAVGRSDAVRPHGLPAPEGTPAAPAPTSIWYAPPGGVRQLSAVVPADAEDLPLHEAVGKPGVPAAAAGAAARM